MTKAKTLDKLMNFSRYGAMTHLFIMDALTKSGGDLPQLARETNDKRLQRCIRVRPETISEIEAHANAVVAAGEEEVIAAFDKSGASRMFNPAVWFKSAVEVADEMKKAA
jgi:hypothetical protein